MTLLLHLAFVASALGAAVNIETAASTQPLSISLANSGNSAIKATIQNTGPEPLRLYTAGSLLDDDPIEKTEVYSEGKLILKRKQRFKLVINVLTSSHIAYPEPVPFYGIRSHLITTNLNENAFRTIGVNESIEVEWDPAEAHDLSAGGHFDYRVSGQFLVAEPNSTVITGFIPFNSTLPAEVNGTTASDVYQAAMANLLMSKRSTMGGSCTPAQHTQVRAAERTCNQLALKAAAVAKASNRHTERYLKHYFKAADGATRTEVKNVFRKVARECSASSTSQGAHAEINCSHNPERCDGSRYASTVIHPGSVNWIVYCPHYFSELPPQTAQCHADDQATTTLHEVTHVPQVHGTVDVAYRYDGVTQLGRADALNNADTYALFANGEFLFTYQSLGAPTYLLDELTPTSWLLEDC